MGVLDTFLVVLRNMLAMGRVLQEEGIMGITSGVSLWLEEGVKVPERAFDKLLSGHLFETELKEDFTVLSTLLEKRMQVTTIDNLTLSIEVI